MLLLTHWLSYTFAQLCLLHHALHLHPTHTALSCACPCPAAIVNGLVQGVNGLASMDCDPTGACSIKLTGLPVAQLDATCQAGECLVPTDQTLNVTDGALRGVCRLLLGRGACDAVATATASRTTPESCRICACQAADAFR